MPHERDLGHARVSLSRGSLSGDLLGKFSAIVRPRRTSHAGDNNYSGALADALDGAEDPSAWSDGEGTTPSASSASKGLGFMRRFSRATTPFAVVAEEETLPSSSSASSASMVLRRMLEADEPERQRRFDLEVMSFAMLHAHFHPHPGLAPEVGDQEEEEEDASQADDNQVEEELQRAVDSSAADEEDDDDDHAPVRRKSRETTTDADEYAALHDNRGAYGDDDDHALMVLRLRRRSARENASHDDQAQDDHDHDQDDEDEDEDDDQEDQNDADHPHVGELNFDPEHLPSSVRRLVREIENASFHEPGGAAASGASNQDDEDHQPSSPAAPPCPTEQPDTRKQSFAPRLSDPLAHGKAPAARRTTIPLVVHHNHFGAPPPPPVAPFMGPAGPSSYLPMEEVQEDLTKSMRRLVIGLQQEVEAQDHHHHHNNHDGAGHALPFISRRRGNSCPQPYTASAATAATRTTRAEPVAASSAPAASSAMESRPTRADMRPTQVQMEAPRWRKRSTLARLAPKFLDTFRRKRKSYLYTDEELESIEGARWKIVELAFRFGGKHRAYLVQAVNMFFPLIKYGRHGGPHATRLHCNRCGTLQWQHKRGGLSDAVDLADVLQVIDGRQTAVFRKYVASRELDPRSLSLIFKDRTLDLETQSASHRDWLMSALRTLVAYAKKQRQAEQRAIAEHALLPLDELLSESSGSALSRDELLAPDGSTLGGRPVLLW